VIDAGSCTSESFIVEQINLVVFMRFRDEIIAGETDSESVRDWEPRFFHEARRRESNPHQD
jgi:hypothetical protein